MNMDLPTIVSRITIIKQLHRRALDTAREPEPFCYSAVLSFHDAIEWFLQLCGEIHNTGSRETRFMDWFDLINGKIKPRSITLKEQIRILHDVRGDYKHRHIIPSAATLVTLSRTCTQFLKENSKLIFGLDFDSLSLMDLIDSISAKDLIKKSQEYWTKGDSANTARCLSAAFEELLSDFETKLQNQLGFGHDFFNANTAFTSSFFVLGHEFSRSRLGDFIDNSNESFKIIRKSIRMLSFGLDYHRYLCFQVLVPFLWKDINDGIHFTSSQNQIKMTEAAFEFCLNFVIDSALKLQTKQIAIFDISEALIETSSHADEQSTQRT